MTKQLVFVNCLAIVIGCSMAASNLVEGQEPAAKASDSNSRSKVLQRFVGVWDQGGTFKPSKWNPDGGKFTGKESTVWALKNRIILTREMSQPSGKKTLLISTYDSERDAYPFWCFDSKGLLGTQWLLKWNPETETTSGRSIDSPPAWTSGGQDRFPDANTIVNRFWMRDENGKLLMEVDSRRTRLPADREAAIVAAWEKREPADDLPAELKVLDRMVGTWDEVSIRKPAVWAPEGGRVTAKVTRQWILNGRFIMDTSIHSDGTESINLHGFDPQSKAYRSWWFNSEGHRNTATGSWNEKSQTISWVSKLDDGKTMHFSGRFANRNQEVVDLKVTDADGKVYFDMDSVATRRAIADDKQPDTDADHAKPTDQSKLQGTWGAVTYVQNGEGEGEEPIAPEDSAIRLRFNEDQFSLLAFGNAGETPKGSYKLGSDRTHKTIDVVLPSNSNEGLQQVISGIYKFDGETLYICFAIDGARRPSEFKSAPGSHHTMIVLKRVKE